MFIVPVAIIVPWYTLRFGKIVSDDLHAHTQYVDTWFVQETFLCV